MQQEKILIISEKATAFVYRCNLVVMYTAVLITLCRLYTEVQVSTLFTQPRAEGPRLCKSRRDRTEVYNGLVPWAMWP